MDHKLTPKVYVERIREFFGGVIDLDPCPRIGDHVRATRRLFRPAHDGLKEPWAGRVFINPPWGYDFDDRGSVLVPWLEKCAGEMLHGAEIIAMIPTAPTSALWQEHVFPFAKACCFVEGHEPIRLVNVDGTLGDIVHVSFLYYGHRPARFAHGVSLTHKARVRGFSDLGHVVAPL